MNLLVASNASFAVFQTLPVFFMGQHKLRIHEVLRERAWVRWRGFLHASGAHYLVRDGVA